MYGSYTSVLEGVAESEDVRTRTEVSGGGGRYVSALSPAHYVCTRLLGRQRDPGRGSSAQGSWRNKRNIYLTDSALYREYGSSS